MRFCLSWKEDCVYSLPLDAFDQQWGPWLVHAEAPAPVRHLLELFVLEPQPVAFFSSLVPRRTLSLPHVSLVVFTASNIHPLESASLSSADSVWLPSAQYSWWEKSTMQTQATRGRNSCQLSISTYFPDVPLMFYNGTNDESMEEIFFCAVFQMYHKVTPLLSPVYNVENDLPLVQTALCWGWPAPRCSAASHLVFQDTLVILTWSHYS